MRTGHAIENKVKNMYFLSIIFLLGIWGRESLSVHIPSKNNKGKARIHYMWLITLIALLKNEVILTEVCLNKKPFFVFVHLIVDEEPTWKVLFWDAVIRPVFFLQCSYLSISRMLCNDMKQKGNIKWSLEQLPLFLSIMVFRIKEDQKRFDDRYQIHASICIRIFV